MVELKLYIGLNYSCFHQRSNTQNCRMLLDLFKFLLLLSILICGIESAVDRVKNFRIERIEILNKRDETETLFNSAAAMKSKAKESDDKFPEEMTAHFEAFGKNFEMKLKRNDNLVSRDFKIQGADDSEFLDSFAYNGISLKINDQPVLTNLFARFLATIKPDGEISLQGGFEWEKTFFKLISSNHPTTKFHISPNEISLLKRSETTKPTNSDSISDDLIILKESMDPNQKKSFGFSFNSGSNSTVAFKCGHDDLNFNNDPKGVANDFLHKLNQVSENTNSNLINPLTVQYYLSKRAAGSDTTNEFGCPANRKVLYIGVAVDSAYMAKFGGNRQAAVSNILTDFNLVSAIYEKSFNIELGVLSILLLGTGEGGKNNAVPWDLPCNKGVNIGSRLNAFSKWRDGQNKDVGKRKDKTAKINYI